ncbi:helix-turn-helix domain-containing protein [Chitinophaga sp.]|uniref:helix-turn-helix domain-containing protein n=1 Tax=Chitinophaga sp. TaxID=1869181 RepID=UPI0026286F4D|nr:helix-turn-helix domain-containing protein [uncultured Chitinophaga sp.]
MNIANKKEYYEALAEIESLLMILEKDLTSAEEMRLVVLSTAVEAWEEDFYPMPLKPDIRAILMHVMQNRDFNQSQLATALQVSASLVSGILSGNKQPNLEVLKGLHEKFQVDGNVLLESL